MKAASVPGAKGTSCVRARPYRSTFLYLRQCPLPTRAKGQAIERRTAYYGIWRQDARGPSARRDDPQHRTLCGRLAHLPVLKAGERLSVPAAVQHFAGPQSRDYYRQRFATAHEVRPPFRTFPIEPVARTAWEVWHYWISAVGASAEGCAGVACGWVACGRGESISISRAHTSVSLCV